MKLAVIPARGGSKRIPRKNIKPFCGKPIIAWSIEAAIESGCFDRIVVSTDDEEIAAVSRKYGAEVPFMRPVELADDHTTTIPVIRHAIGWYMAHGQQPDFVCCIYATAPFIRAQDIRNGFEVMKREGSDYAFTVTSYTAPIQRALRITGVGRTAMFQPEHFNSRSQDLDPAYHDAAQFYWGLTKAWVDEQLIFYENAMPIILSCSHVQDIDTPEDWIRAELLFKVIQEISLNRE
jgi:N-acylneuraminate cytidylyltransferase